MGGCVRVCVRVCAYMCGCVRARASPTRRWMGSQDFRGREEAEQGSAILDCRCVRMSQSPQMLRVAAITARARQQGGWCHAHARARCAQMFCTAGGDQRSHRRVATHARAHSMARVHARNHESCTQLMRGLPHTHMLTLALPATCIKRISHQPFRQSLTYSLPHPLILSDTHTRTHHHTQNARTFLFLSSRPHRPLTSRWLSISIRRPASPHRARQICARARAQAGSFSCACAYARMRKRTRTRMRMRM